MTLHCFGDSFTYGYNFSDDSRQQSVYPFLLSKRLNVDYVNHAIPGASTWRTARLLSNMELTENDIVVISWGFSSRFEFPAGTQDDVKNSKIYNGEDTSFVWMGDVIENYNDIYCRRIFPQITYDAVQARADVKLLAKFAYNKFYNQPWFENMFLVMFNSTLHILKNSKCKFIMFNAVDVPYSNKNKSLEIPEYILGSQNTMNYFIRQSDEKKYWNELEHEQVSEVLYNHLKTRYNIF